MVFKSRLQQRQRFMIMEFTNRSRTCSSDILITVCTQQVSQSGQNTLTFIDASCSIACLRIAPETSSRSRNTGTLSGDLSRRKALNADSRTVLLRLQRI